MKFYILLLTLLLTGSSCKTNKNPISSQTIIESQDLDLLIGEWIGSLTYLDYSSGEPYTMPANLVVGKGKNDNELLLKNIFPNENSANNTDKLKISKDRASLNNNRIKSRTQLESGEVQIVTEHLGKDDGKKARIQHTYLVSSAIYSDTKEVKFENEDEWILRSKFSYKRKE